MRKYLLMVVAVLALATYEAAHACGAHTAKKAELQSKFSGNNRVAGIGGVQTKNRGGSGSEMDSKFFDKLKQGESTGSDFTTTISGGSDSGTL